MGVVIPTRSRLALTNEAKALRERARKWRQQADANRAWAKDRTEMALCADEAADRAIADAVQIETLLGDGP